MLFLGHDEPQYGMPFKWFVERYDKLWLHCKNVEAVVKIQSRKDFLPWEDELHYFWHQDDDITLTSKNILWTYPSKKLTDRSICVMPEIIQNENSIDNRIYGVCSDNIEHYKNLLG